MKKEVKFGNCQANALDLTQDLRLILENLEEGAMQLGQLPQQHNCLA
jgi:hypothetical protein